jgi:zinc protease
LNRDLFAGTPYAHDPLGTKRSFDATTGAMLKSFYRRWYAPQDAILVIVGAVEPHATLEKVRRLFGGISGHPLPPRPAVTLKPVKSESFKLSSNLPYTLAFIAYRFPGTASPDYAAAQVLADVLSSQRAELYGMVPAGKALAAEFGIAESYPRASVGFAVLALPAGAKTADAVREMRGILLHYAEHGVPEDLVTAAKRHETVDAELERSSIPGLANVWSNALAAEGRGSPDEDLEAIQRVTVADVDRVAKQLIAEANSISSILEPVPSGQPVATKGFGGAEQLLGAPSKPVGLPSWAAAQLARLDVPAGSTTVSDSTLPNGLRLIVKSDASAGVVSVFGSVRHDAGLETPPGQEGIADVLNGLFSFGTDSLDRLSFRKALDDIAANESAGYTFSLNVLPADLSRGVELLADNELHPAMPAQAFSIVKQQTAQFVAGNLKSPEYRTARALDTALLPPRDPQLREATPESIAKVSLEAIQRYRTATVRPDLTTIVVIGDVSAAEARSVMEKWFGEWHAEGPKPDTALPPVPANKPAAVGVADPEAIQDSVYLAEQLESSRFDPDYYPLELGTQVLGGGFYASRLYHDLRQTAGYVYTVDVRLDASKTRADYEVTYGCDPENVSKARALIQRDLERMRSEQVPDEELYRAKALLLRKLVLQESSEEAVARGLLARAELDLPLDEPIVAARKYHDVTAAEVESAFARLIRSGDLVQVVRGPPPH